MAPARNTLSALPIAARPAAVVVLAALLAACAPFQRETTAGMPGTPGAAALVAAESRIGAPYRYGGSGPDAFDCSGLVSYAYRQAGISVPRTAAEQYAAAQPVTRGDLRPGDLVFFRLSGRDVSHVGIYAGNDQFVHAPQSGGEVRMASLDDEWYRKRYAGAGRLY
ncbi:MAG: NlpC/P60 family protein [Gammaproteobacteria bacterium]|nr:NlpC/P60 family protein [Gammaproteobacteria bacterium]